MRKRVSENIKNAALVFFLEKRGLLSRKEALSIKNTEDIVLFLEKKGMLKREDVSAVIDILSNLTESIRKVVKSKMSVGDFMKQLDGLPEKYDSLVSYLKEETLKWLERNRNKK